MPALLETTATVFPEADWHPECGYAEQKATSGHTRGTPGAMHALDLCQGCFSGEVSESAPSKMFLYVRAGRRSLRGFFSKELAETNA